MIVIGGSLGGAEALGRILILLPRGFRIPIAVVLHRHKDSQDLLVPFLQRHCSLPVSEAEDKEPFQGGHVYMAPADYHLMIDRDAFALSTDDPVNFARPSVDVLFESAAEWMGADLIAVVLTGSGTDGARGAKRVKERGGTVMVQDPRTAEGPWMPEAAICATEGAHVLTLTNIADRLSQRLPYVDHK